MLKVALKSPPVDGKANAELLRVIARAAGVPRGEVRLLSGQTSRRKRVLVQRASVETLAERFSL